MNATELLQALNDAVARQDNERFFSLCQQNAQAIFEHFAEWRTLPPDIRDKPDRVNAYVNALMHTAQLFQQSGYPQLLEILMPPNAQNPLARWQDRLVEVQQLANAAANDRALAEADALLAELQQSVVTGPGLIDVTAKVQGLRGTILFALKRYAEAKAATKLALDECIRGNDEEGVRVYRQNLAMLDVHAPERPELVDVEIEVLEGFAKARRLTDLGRYRASNDALAKLLALTEPAARVVEGIRPHILARMAYNEFNQANVKAAVQLCSSAHDLCVQRGDAESAAVYAENLLLFQAAKPSLWSRMFGRRA